MEQKRKRVSLVVPTYKEAASLPHLIDRVAGVRELNKLDLDLIIVDDDSRDGSAELVRARPEPWVRIIVRTEERGLSQSVLAGLRAAQGDYLVCMDADLSHPPEALPEMLARLDGGDDFVVASRYVEGGTTADDWGVLRWLNSRVATLLARPLTTIEDPMSGYFALTRATFDRGTSFSPTGYKIALELIVKCGCERVAEVPIHFELRRYGESKLTLKQQLLYLRHLRRLYIFKFRIWSELTQFLVVGALGTVVNVATLTIMLALGLSIRPSVAIAILVSMTSNFVLNRRFSFRQSANTFWLSQYVRYVMASSIAAVLNGFLTLYLVATFPKLPPQLATLISVAVTTVINFIASRYLVFRDRHIRTKR